MALELWMSRDFAKNIYKKGNPSYSEDKKLVKIWS